MRSIDVPVDRETRDRLETECDLLGFDDVVTYVGWIIDNRAAIDQGTDRDQLLSAYAERVEQLERQLDARETSEDPAGEGEVGTDRATAREAEEGLQPGERREAVTPRDGEPDATDTGQPTETASADGGTDTRRTPDGPNRDLFVSGSFGERVGRIAGDEVNEVVDELTGVETERVDAFARKAVAQTREQLGRDPETGLTYRSSTDLVVPGARPGSDIADLDAIDVPGRSEETREKRREAVGAALAFLRDEGTALRGDFVGEVYEQYPAGYGTEDGWWGCIKQGLRQADPVDPAGRGSRIWEYDA